MLSTKMLCNDTRILCFVEIRFGKANRKGFDLSRACTGHERYYCRRIDSATEKSTHGNIAYQSDTHRLRQPLFHFLEALFFAGRLVDAIGRQLPVFGDSDLTGSKFEQVS